MCHEQYGVQTVIVTRFFRTLDLLLQGLNRSLARYDKRSHVSMRTRLPNHPQVFMTLPLILRRPLRAVYDEDFDRASL